MPHPLVTCITPTADRHAFLAQALSYFLAQDYPNREIIVVDDGTEAAARVIPDDPRIRYVRLPKPMRIGHKRNLACELARGEIVVHWDDDDWHGVQRLSRQVAAIGKRRADVTALNLELMLDLPAGKFWSFDQSLLEHGLFKGVLGATIAFRRSDWLRCGGYPDLSLGEDVGFLSRLLDRGARLERLSSNGLFVYLRHAGNTWRFHRHELGGVHAWRSVPPPDFMPHSELAFYRSIALAARAS
jgi:glycosyltransferase involved in cell wall biosynthesis